MAEKIHSLSWSPNGRWIACSDDSDRIKIWEVVEQAVIQTLETSKPGARSVSWSPDSELLACGQGNWRELAQEHVQVWRVATGKKLWWDKEKTRGCYSVRFSPSGRHLVSGHGSGAANVWDVETGNKTLTISIEPDVGNLINGVCFSPDGRYIVIATCYEDLLLICDTNGQVQQELTYEKQPTWVDFEHPLSFCPDSRWVARGSQGGQIYLWQTVDFSLTSSPLQHDAAVYALAWSPGGRFLASGSRDGEIVIWDMPSQSQLCAMIHRPLHTLCYHPLGSLLASGGNDASIYIWDVAPASPRLGQCLLKLD